VAAGTTLLFANAGGKPHSLSADDGSFSTGIVQPGPEAGRFAGTNATLTLDKPGTFTYHCDIHPQAMKGTITVTGTQVTGGPAPPSAGARSAAIDLEDFQFKEAQVSVAPGAQLTFSNKGQAPHTATFDDVPLDTGQVAPGGAGQLSAPLKPGSYSYKCTVHPAKMRGVLVVLGQNTPDPVKNTTTTAPPGGGATGTQSGNASPVTVAPTPPAGYTASAGPSGALSAWVIVTAVIAAFLAGVGITPFLRRGRRCAAAADSPTSAA
jgi:plastocyanin